MKYIYIIILIFAFKLHIYAQIDPYEGITNVDSCMFDSQTTHMLILDTSSNNIWQIGKPHKPFFYQALSLPYAIVTDTVLPYKTSNHSYFDLKIPSRYMDIIIGFKHKFQTDSGIDGGYIQISEDKGKNWINIRNYNCLQFNSENLYTTKDSLQGGELGFSGQSNEWINTRFQIIWMMPVKTDWIDTIMFRFNFISDSIQTNKDGWMIDDILVSVADLGSGINEIELNQSNMKISPNPMEEYTWIEHDCVLNEPLNLYIYNAIGQLVKVQGNINASSILLERDGMTSGIYIVKFYKGSTPLSYAKLILK